MDAILFESFIPIINQIGFPIFVTAYLLFMKQKADQRTTEVLEEIKCIQQQLLESKLQVAQAIQTPTTNNQDGREPIA